MSDGNKNEILEEQRKARQEFLELKKMRLLRLLLLTSPELE